jgi:hypothetical protein
MLLIGKVLLICAFLNELESKKLLNIMDYDRSEVKKMTTYNQTRIDMGLEGIQISVRLVQMAQREANELASLHSLRKPKFKTNIGYRGYSVKVIDFFNDKYGLNLSFSMSNYLAK